MFFSACAEEGPCKDANCSVEVSVGNLGPFQIGKSKVKTIETVVRAMPKSELAPAPQPESVVSGDEIMKLAGAPVISVQGEYDDEYGGHPSAILEFTDGRLANVTTQGAPHFSQLFNEFSLGKQKALVLQDIQDLLVSGQVTSANWLVQESQAFVSGDLTGQDTAFLLQFDKLLIVESDEQLMSTYELTFLDDRLSRIKLSRTDTL